MAHLMPCSPVAHFLLLKLGLPIDALLPPLLLYYMDETIECPCKQVMGPESEVAIRGRYERSRRHWSMKGMVVVVEGVAATLNTSVFSASMISLSLASAVSKQRGTG